MKGKVILDLDYCEGSREHSKVRILYDTGKGEFGGRLFNQKWDVDTIAFALLVHYAGFVGIRDIDERSLYLSKEYFFKDDAKAEQVYEYGSMLDQEVVNRSKYDYCYLVEIFTLINRLRRASEVEEISFPIIFRDGDEELILNEEQFSKNKDLYGQDKKVEEELYNKIENLLLNGLGSKAWVLKKSLRNKSNNKN